MVVSSSFEKHVEDLRNVLRRLRDKGIKLKPSKCDLFKREVRFLGQLVSENGCRLDQADTQVTEDLKEQKPSTVKEVRHLVDLLGYYRKYISDFSRRAKPLYDLLKMPEKPVSKQRKRGKSDKAGQRLSRERIEWTETHQNILCELIDVLTSSKVMAFPSFEQPFFPHTDASHDGLGAILYQAQDDGHLAVIAYGSNSSTAGVLLTFR